MSVGSKVSSDRNGSRQEYELKKLLGTGAIGGVYLGEGPGGAQIAVKIAHERLPADLEQRFWQELSVLNRLEGPSGGRYFPRAWRGTIVDSGRPVLCMELVRGQQLGDLARETGGRLDERIALSAAVQYAEMIRILHANAISCPDRKGSDVYWDSPPGAAEEGRLTVLDWNVVAEGEKADRARDLYIFGALWYEFLTGTPPAPIEERVRRPLEKHPHWEQISLGTRAILQRVLSPDPARRYSSAEELKKALVEHWQDFRRDPADLAREADRFASQAHDAANQGLASLHRAEGTRYYSDQEANDSLMQATGQMAALQGSLSRALRLADLARRRDAPGAERPWHAAQELRAEMLKLIATGSQRVRMVQYTAALQWLTVAETAVADDPAEMLKLQRWRNLAQTGQAAITENLSLKQRVDVQGNMVLDVAANMIKALETLQDGPIGQAGEIWTSLEPKLKTAAWRESTDAGRRLWSLGHEVAFWQAWNAAQRLDENRQYETAGDKLEQAMREVVQVVYGAHILAVLQQTPDSLSEKVSAMRNRAQVEGRIVERLKAGREAMAKGDFIGARDALQAGWVLAGGAPELEAERAELLRAQLLAEWLPKLDRALASKAWPSVFEAIRCLAAADVNPQEPVVGSRVRAAVTQAVRDLKCAEDPYMRLRNFGVLRDGRYLETLSNEMSTLYEKHDHWLSRAMNSSLT